tara:strand:+ start:20741 stop:21325 length:585 start_codon:yes stop_codon:yes gene_type:complete
VSTSHVTLIGQGGGIERQIVTVDSHDNALVIIDALHANIHRGIMYTASMQGAVLSDGVLEIILQVGADEFHAAFNGAVSQNMIAQIYEGVTFSAAGTSLPCFNRDRESANTATMAITHTPTLTLDGTLMTDIFIPGGAKSTASGGTAASFNEWELAPNTDYLLRISNTVVSPASAGHAGIDVEFYEPNQTPDTP